jgi:hypothetical protein
MTDTNSCFNYQGNSVTIKEIKKSIRSTSIMETGNYLSAHNTLFRKVSDVFYL